MAPPPQDGAEPSFLRQMASFALDITPGVGSLKASAELWTGHDAVTNEQVSWYLSAIGLIPLVGKVGKVPKVAVKVPKVAAKVWRSAIAGSSAAIKELRKAFKVAAKSGKAAKAVKGGARLKTVHIHGAKAAKSHRYR